MVFSLYSPQSLCQLTVSPASIERKKKKEIWDCIYMILILSGGSLSI